MELKRLNGWQRIWVVVTALWVFWFAAFIAKHFPTEQKQLAFWAQSMAFSAIYENPDKTLVEKGLVSVDRVRALHANLGDKQYIEAAPKLYPKVNFSETLARYESSMAGLTKHQAETLAGWLLIMILPPLALYLAGLIVAWIRRGFKSPA
jgi:hypothetical protein